ncbi:beta-1,3-N-acetylglucosaminyltransferase lunatic protein, putative [Actinidia rufa]|uniref:Beta-1,3-N-acetylglucosaminyltransferase lunatic protein, putative n=1 Tax=Actinidia rufa TaxID=165716 RepID=A0A7J0GWV0_9ERIC|nr:beta-1,3-N-acetylglucosaminyltransferase lunatic protein, putative [Actinidia rufa]
MESFRVGLPNVRWIVMGTMISVFFTDTLVSVLARYDHRQMHYVGANSESVEQDVMHSYEMAFSGGGFTSQLRAGGELVNALDGCL